MNLANSHGFSYVYKIHIIFSYTTPLFYAKMSVAHTFLLCGLVCGSFILHEVRMNFFFSR